MASRRVRPRTIAAYSTNSRAYLVGLASPILSEPLIDMRQHRLAECEVDLAIFLCNCVSARPADIQRLHSGVDPVPQPVRASYGRHVQTAALQRASIAISNAPTIAITPSTNAAGCPLQTVSRVAPGRHVQRACR